MPAVRGALQHFAQELARRRVLRVLIAYVVAVFGALQGLDIMVTRLELPGVWMRWAVLLALAGLPAAAVLSWIFDWTREGVVRTPPAAHAPQQHRAVTVAALTLLIGRWPGSRFATTATGPRAPSSTRRSISPTGAS